MPGIGVGIGVPFRRDNTVPDIPVDESKSLAVLDSTVNGEYNTYSCLAHHPTMMNKVIMTYLEKANHSFADPGVLKIRVSDDNGQTFAAATTIYDPGAGRIVMDNFNGYSSNGRFHVLTTVVDETTGANCALMYHYSDNNGISFTTADITSVVTNVTRPIFRMSSQLIENNGVLLAGFYRLKADTTSSERMCLRLVAGTWTAVSVEITTAYENEIAFERLGGDNLIALVREDATPFDFIQYKSTDNGLTWTRLQNSITFGITNTYGGASPYLTKFRMNGEDIIACYASRGGAVAHLYVIFGRAIDLLELGPVGWNYSTMKISITSANANHPVKQGSILHYNNNYNAIASETIHHVDTGLTQADLLLYELDATDYATLFANLFPSYSADADSNAFNAVNNTNPTAINNLVGGLKAYSLWTKIKAAYPMIGGTAALHKFNLVNPADSDAAFRLTFVNGAGVGWIHSATGAKPDGTGAYADTHFDPLNNLTLYSAAIGYYSRTNVSEASYEMGAYIFATPNYPALTIRFRYTDEKGRFAYTNGTGASGITGSIIPDSLGFILGSRTSSSLSYLFHEGVQVGTSTTATLNTCTTKKVALGAINYNDTIGSFSTKECAFAIITDGLTPLEAYKLTRIIHYFQKALGRNV